MAEDKAPGKGWFGRARLPVALSYVRLADRNQLLLVAGALGLIGAILIAGNFWLQDGTFVSSGPLSASHATLENNCASCHVPFASVTTEKCSVCHERSLTHVGSFSFASHYAYVSGDLTRAFTREGEVACAACHTEHRGRDVRPTVVAGDRCVTCHAYAPFGEAHPQFAFVAQPGADNEALKFTHIKHVERVLDRNESGDIEGSCLTCHEPARDGLGFEPIQFERSCTSCHLGPEVTSADLDVVASGALVSRTGDRAELRLGVETLEMIRRRRGPGEAWAMSTNPTLFDEGGGIVTKVGIAHEDPWITHNLRSLRRVLYPSRGLADLLVASADVDERNRRVLYEEAVRTLKTYAAGLQGQSEDWVQEELAEIALATEELERRIADPATPLAVSKFRVDRRTDPALTADQIVEINEYAAEIARPCLMCHQVENATIVRPAADQRVLRRAVFNHRAHVIQRGCLECHTAIPFAEYLDTGQPVDASIDRAAIHNIPGIEVCQVCHAPAKASTECRTCHVFHPGSDVRADLMRSPR